MDKQQAENLMNRCALPDTCNTAVFKETHISWVIIADNFAFKVKRPVKFSFLDFSTPDKRRFYCNQEIKLNRRLSPDMYLKVIPITRQMAEAGEGNDDLEVIDYAVQMKRMDNNLEMDRMLKKNEVTTAHIDSLAEKIARFHKKARVLKNAFATLAFHEKYADLQSVIAVLADNAGAEWETRINECVAKSFEYLNSIRNLSNQRVITGFQRDCHGDLNASNIFLYDDPVIFDCIEFNSDYRRIDILNDIAFLCVDLEFYERPDLSDRFYQKYLLHFGTEDNPQFNKLFCYYKSYRAGIRAKVTLINLNENSENIQNEAIRDAKKYIGMMEAYLSDF